MFIISALLHYYVGKVIIRVLFPNYVDRDNLFTKSYTLILLFVIAFHYFSIYIFPFHANEFLSGIYWDDDRIYHTQAAELAARNLVWDLKFHGDWAFLWQYIIAINYFIFGVDSILPKITNALFFTIGTLSLVGVARILFGEKKISYVLFKLMLTFIPLIFYSATLAKEVSVFVILTYTVYVFVAQPFKSYSTNYLVLTLLFIAFILSRHQFAILLLLLVVLYNISNIKMLTFKRGFGLIILLVLLVGFYNSPLMDMLSIKEKIEYNTNNNALFLGRERADNITLGESNYIDMLSTVISAPGMFSYRLMFGYMIFTFSPPPTSIPKSMNSLVEVPQHFFQSIYSPIWYILIVPTFFGIRFALRNKKTAGYNFLILSYTLISFTVIILTKGDFFRYRIAIFPFIFIYTALGIHTFRYWKKNIPIAILVMTILLLISRNVLTGG